MGKYNDQQLQEMQKTDPMKYFYYSNEDTFNKLGIDLDSDNWELPLYHQAGPQGTRDKYTYFHDIVTAPGGATVFDPARGIVNVVNAKTKTVADEPGKKPEFKGVAPDPAPPAPSRWLKFLNIITFGLYGAAVLAQYAQAVEEHQKQTEKYNKDLEKFENTTLPKYEERVKAREDYRSNLQKMGKNLDEVDAAIAEHAEIANRMEPINSKKSEIRRAVKLRAHGRDRLDFLMGHRLDAKKNEQVKQDAIEDGILLSRVFAPEAPKVAEEVLMDIKLPECKDFSNHEIALLGLAAFSTEKNLVETPAHPIPGRGDVEDKRTQAEKNEDYSMWYIRGEALFTRQRREISHSIPWVNNARADLASALKSYNAGQKSPLASILTEGLRMCTHHVMFQESVLDSNTLADYATYAGELLDIVDRNEALRLSMYGNGFTKQDYRDACICRNIGKVWDRGIDAMANLADNPKLTAEQKTDAIVDIIGLRVTQSMIYKHALEISNSEQYTTKISNSLAQVAQTQKEISKMLHSPADKKTPEYIALNSKLKAYSGVAAQLQSGAMHNKFGLSIDFGDKIDGMYGDNGRPEELRNLIKSKIDVNKLATLSNDDILMELTPQNSKKYVEKVFPQKQKQSTMNQPAPSKQAGKVLGA